MNLHVPTLLTALVVGWLMLTLQLGMTHPGVRGRPEVLSWSRGNWAMLAGFTALGLRLWVPLELSIVLGNGLVCLGLAWYHQSFHRLLRPGPPPKWSLWAQPLFWLALVGLSMAGTAPRTAVVSWFYVALLAPSLWLLVRHGWRAERALRAVTVTVVLSVLALAVRAVHVLLAPEQYGALLQPSLGQGLTMLTTFMALLGAGFGFVLAVFERVARQMEDMASHDGLTGCLNRSTTDALLEHALARAHRDGTPLAFALLDLDHFKQVNDQHGHRAGDEVLRRFAAVARQRLRDADVLGRTGGEEFGLVLPATDEAGARRLVEEVRQATDALQVTDALGQAVRVTLSAGVAVADGREAVSADRLYGRADQALYEAKRLGRNRVEMYADSRQRQVSLLASD